MQLGWKGGNGYLGGQDTRDFAGEAWPHIHAQESDQLGGAEKSQLDGLSNDEGQVLEGAEPFREDG